QVTQDAGNRTPDRPKSQDGNFHEYSLPEATPESVGELDLGKLPDRRQIRWPLHDEPDTRAFSVMRRIGDGLGHLAREARVPHRFHGATAQHKRHAEAPVARDKIDDG